MKNTKKAFTLVELIVVITILAVLATVAFISFSGQTQEAKKTKVVSDIANLAKAVEIFDGGIKNAMTGDLTANEIVNTSTVNSGAILSSTGVTYKVGNIDFVKLNQNPEEFKDSDGKGYLFSYVINDSFSKYQIVGQAKDAAGDFVPLVKGSYYTVISSDAGTLVSASGASTAPVVHDTAATVSIY